MGRHTDHGPDADGMLPQACLCEDKVRPRPVEYVTAGRGWQCGPQCAPPTRKAQMPTVTYTLPAAGPPFTRAHSERVDTAVLATAAQMVADLPGTSLSANLARIANRIHDLAIATAHDEQGTTPS